MLTTEQLDNWFTYHPPTEETAPKYVDLRRVEEVFRNTILSKNVSFSDITDAARCFVQSIDYNAPDCADKTAAIRCVRLARNAANEFLTIMKDEQSCAKIDLQLLLQIAVCESLKARWQACSAIACEGK